MSPPLNTWMWRLSISIYLVTSMPVFGTTSSMTSEEESTKTYTTTGSNSGGGSTPGIQSLDVMSKKLLEEIDEAMDVFDRIDANAQRTIHAVDDTVKLMQNIHKHRANVEAHQSNIQDTWTNWNQFQYQELQMQIKDALHAEVKRREHAQAQVAEYLRQKEYWKAQKKQELGIATTTTGGDESAKARHPLGLTHEEMEDILSLEEFMEKRDEKVGKWVEELLDETIQRRPLPQYEWAHRADAILAATATSSPDDNGDKGCLTLLEATEFIQQALTNYSHDDGLGMTDHAQGGWISHQATSPTYQAALSGETWGGSRWRDYLIPEEVEEHILSHVKGWKNWPVWPVKYLPHGLITTLFGGSTMTTAPPETILQPATFPGACWPMQGSSGQVTIVLPYAIHPTALSINHVSRLLAPKDDGRQTAPKTMRVWAYGSCGETNCHGREYDESTMYELFRGQTITYDLEGSSVQTFWIQSPTSSGEASLVDEDRRTASCSAPEDYEMEKKMASSCSSGPLSALSEDSLVRAIKLEVIDNWGNEDYTCIYRARVHGNPSR